MTNKILVIKLGALGDFIQAFGAIAAIRKHHAQAHITLLTTKPFVALAKASDYFDEIWIDEKPKFNPLNWLAQARRFNSACFTRVYDLQNNDRTALYFKLFHPKPEWAGAVAGASHRNMSPERTKFQAFYGHVETLKNAGIANVELDKLEWMNGDVARFNLQPPYVLLIPGSSPRHAQKRWPAAAYRQLAEILIARGMHPVIIGSKEEAGIADQICDGHACTNLTGSTEIADIPALARAAYAAIGNDTGPAHIISVTGCPTIMLFCTRSSSVQKHGPLGARVMTLEAEKLDTIKPNQVMVALENLLDQGA